MNHRDYREKEKINHRVHKEMFILKKKKGTQKKKKLCGYFLVSALVRGCVGEF